jgi:hypothetical protein
VPRNRVSIEAPGEVRDIAIRAEGDTWVVLDGTNARVPILPAYGVKGAKVERDEVKCLESDEVAVVRRMR